MHDSNHSGYTNFDGSPDLAPDTEPDYLREFSALPVSLPDIEPERWLYLASGIILAFGGLMRRGPVGFLMSALGSGLLYQGVTGLNPLKRLLVNQSRNGFHTPAPQQEPLDIDI